MMGAPSMNRIDSLWESPHKHENVVFLRAKHPGIFEALARLDALGFRLFQRLPGDLVVESPDAMVGLVFLRRLSTVLVGIRHLLEASAVEQAKPLVRSAFELYLSVRYLAYGAKHPITPETETNYLGRETRARYYYVEAQRVSIYQRQAVIDGAWGHAPPPAEKGAAMEEEIQERLKKLEREYPVQQQNFGPLRCRSRPKGQRGYYDKKNWYSFGFRKKRVTNIRELAEALNAVRDYHLVYSHLSGLVHPSGTRHDVDFLDDGMALYSPYMLEAFELLSVYTCYWIGMGLMFLTRAYHEESIEDAERVLRFVNRQLDEIDFNLPAGFLGAS